ncbi:PREDICTED: uncharacterized protein LOC106821366 [Priapulus caudatus]|uniref:Uncharacterized protein LOC106821366 n=1 Tax=Priapulus caudatus TaxID=37621 RepID=A0ABM1FAZ5_PRICU|nr:PREDICTED: uncharacterized protein LOC106821366 [Priapulus caudatus]
MCRQRKSAMLGCCVFGVLFVTAGVMEIIVAATAVSRMPLPVYTAACLLWVGTSVGAATIAMAGVAMIVFSVTGNPTRRRSKGLIGISVTVFLVSAANIVMLVVGKERIWRSEEQRVAVLLGYETLYRTAFTMSTIGAGIGLASSFLAVEYIYFLMIRPVLLYSGDLTTWTSPSNAANKKSITSDRSTLGKDYQWVYKSKKIAHPKLTHYRPHHYQMGDSSDSIDTLAVYPHQLSHQVRHSIEVKARKKHLEMKEAKQVTSPGSSSAPSDTTSPLTYIYSPDTLDPCAEDSIQSYNTGFI